MSLKAKQFLIIVAASFLIFILALGGGAFYFLNRINTEDNINNNPDVADEFKPPEVNREEVVINTLLMGVDKSKALSDVMILVSYNKETGKVTMVSIPRDTYVEVDGFKHHKINSLYGIKDSGKYIAMETVGKIFQLPVHYYAIVDFAGVERIIDIIGGVNVNVPMNMDYEDPTQDLFIHLKKGEQVLNGENALKFLRFRSGYRDADLGRIKAQQQFIQSFVSKLGSPKMIPKALALLDEMSKSIRVNMPENEIAGYAIKAAGFKLENLTLHTLPGEAKMLNGVSYYIIDDMKLPELLDQLKKDLGIETTTNK